MAKKWTSPAALLFMVAVQLSILFPSPGSAVPPLPAKLSCPHYTPLLGSAALPLPPGLSCPHPPPSPPSSAVPWTQPACLPAWAAKLQSRDAWEPGVLAQVLQEAEVRQEISKGRHL